MMSSLWNLLKRIIGMDVAWETMTLSRVGIDPASARSLTRVLQPVHTVRLRPEPEEAQMPAPLALSWHGITDTGLVRDHNEDNFTFLDLGDKTLFVVADGMGGHDAGEIASAIAVQAVCSEVREAKKRGTDPLELVERAVQRANTEVNREASRTGSNMGTTLSVALMSDGTAFIGSVGDSRVYWIENASITQITEDHSVVAKLVAKGQLTKEDARNHPRANLLYRTIGNDETVKVNICTVPVARGGTLLLCTDGLWGEVDDEEIRKICAGEKHTDLICARLVQRAEANGGKDNITAIVVKVN
ncbi:MAG: Stp1/IreP family PP2C-type Ser/Thr phosphatase [Nitrospirota bacterium]